MANPYDASGEYANDPDMRAVSIGLDTEHFVTHDRVGRFVVERAHQCRVEALERLARAEPSDALRIAALQWEARIPDLFLQWLDEAITLGRNAEEAIREQDVLDGA